MQRFTLHWTVLVKTGNDNELAWSMFQHALKWLWWSILWMHKLRCFKYPWHHLPVEPCVFSHLLSCLDSQKIWGAEAYNANKFMEGTIRDLIDMHGGDTKRTKVWPDLVDFGWCVLSQHDLLFWVSKKVATFQKGGGGGRWSPGLGYKVSRLHYSLSKNKKGLAQLTLHQRIYKRAGK